MEIGSLYFFTATILGWRKLLLQDRFKDYIIDSLRYLTEKDKLKVYGFVIMPNHMHIIWEMLALNGKEMPHASFMKYTGHKFLADLRAEKPGLLEQFVVQGNDTRKHNFWIRESLPKLLYTPKVIEQKLDYIHENPLQGHWALAKDPGDYKYSSADFYENGVDNFGFLTHYLERI